MKLPIRNRSKKPFTLFVEPYCDEYKVPPGAGALIVLSDNSRHPHSIDVYEDQLSVWDNGGTPHIEVEIISQDEQSIFEALGIACTWLNKLGAKEASEAIVRTVDGLEPNDGYLNARVRVFEAFHSGFSKKDGKASPSSDALPAWPGPEPLATCYCAGGTAAYRNYLDRAETSFPGPDLGPFDTDTVRSAFARAATIINVERGGLGAGRGRGMRM